METRSIRISSFSEKKAAKKQESKPFKALFGPFGGPNNLLALTGTFFLFRSFFGYTPVKNISKYPSGEQHNFWWNPCFHRSSSSCSHRPSYKAVARETKYFNTQRFREFFVLLAGYFEFTETLRGSFLAAYDCCLAYPTPSHTPSGAPLNIAGYSCL